MSHKHKRQKTYGKQHRPSNTISSSPPPKSPPANMSWYPDTNSTDFSQKPPPLPPKKPTSQKAATMPAEPAESDVSTLMEFCDGMSREDSIRYLKAKRNNMEEAAAAFFNGEDISKIENATQWDESIMSADRDGVKDDSYERSHLAPLGGVSAAATRPNSPAPSHRSNLHPTSQEEADADMARAIAESTGMNGQETGVVSTAGQTPYFGPANRDHYSNEQWGMVSMSVTEATDVVPDLAAEDRLLVPGEPRVLKHLSNGDYTPNLLTICGSIDTVREVLLGAFKSTEDYGQDAEWWRGHSIARPKIVHLDGTAAEPEMDRFDELLAETQRLMALLTASDRSYGTAGALTQTDIIKETSPNITHSRTLIELFMQSWCTAASAKRDEEEGDITRLFTTTIGTTAPEGLSGSPDLSLINMQVAIPEGEKKDLFEALDVLLWETNDVKNAMSDNFIEVPAELLVMQLSQWDSRMTKTLGVEVPAEFYVDKYLKENIGATRATRMKMAEGQERISKIEEIERSLKTWRHPNKNEDIDTGQLLKHTLGHFNGQNKIDAAKLDRTSSATEDEKRDPPHYHDVAEKLEKLLLNIESKLKVLDDEKEKTRRAIADMSKAPPQGMEIDDLQHRYTLRGVATKPNITYVLRPVDPQNNDDSIVDDKSSSGMRWWRLEYTETNPPTLTKTQVGDFDVLRAVELEHSSALLVYASDALCDPSSNPTFLPTPLQDFIDRDNALFAAELQAAKSGNATAAYTTSFDMTDVPRESIERRSIDSTRVEGGGSEDGEKLPPAYGSENFYEHSGYGLPPGEKEQVDDDGDVHEIRLPDEEGGEKDVEMEMIERKGGGGMFDSVSE